MVLDTHPLGCDLPQFLLPKSLLLDDPLPKLVLHSLLCGMEPRLCREVTLQWLIQCDLESGQSGSIPFRDICGQARAWGLASGTVWPWAGGPGRLS